MNAYSDIVSVLRRHFDSCIAMLDEVAARCPESLWAEADRGAPIWQHLYHTLTGVEFWFREGEEFVPLAFGKAVSPDLDKQTQECLTKDELREYRGRIQEMCARFFATMDARHPLEESRITEVFTKTDLVLMQIRHVQHHVGYCNSILRAHGIEGAPWVGYGE